MSLSYPVSLDNTPLYFLINEESMFRYVSHLIRAYFSLFIMTIGSIGVLYQKSILMDVYKFSLVEVYLFSFCMFVGGMTFLVLFFVNSPKDALMEKSKKSMA